MMPLFFEEELCSELKEQYRFHIEKACFATDYIPNYILLDSTRNIHSYIEFCWIENNGICSTHWNPSSKYGLINVLRTQYSQLDRPLFFIYKDKKGTFRIIESAIIREHLLEERDDNVSQFIISNSDSLDEVVKQIKNEL